MKEKQKLSEGWELITEDREVFRTKIPGSVYSTLFEHGKIEDPYWRDNEEKVLDLSEKNYEYHLRFDVDEELYRKPVIILKFEGIDTLADIYLNGIFLGHAENMHRRWEYNVGGCLKQKENELKVMLYSPVRCIRERNHECRCDGAPESMQGFPHLRKAHCMFGWDWGPHLPDMGIFREVNLYGYEEKRIENVKIRQHHGENEVWLEIAAEVQDLTGGKAETGNDSRTCQNGGNCGTEYRVIITDPEGKRREYGNSPERIRIENPALWWPNGYGMQSLYTVEVILLQNGQLVDSVQKRIGLRTMNVDTSEDEFGSRFAHVVNGVKIFAMGADYIPEDSILSRTGRERTRELLENCRMCNFNVIRVWGGGYYPDDWFYDLCDEMGLIVWQDFMFACAVYDLNESFEENIAEEILQNVQRIRHHACLGLWCGNNEIEMFMSNNMWIRNAKQKSDYIYISEYMIPGILKEADPDTFYWPSSPSSGGSFDVPNDENRGDSHYWEVWHGGAPFTEFRKYCFRYLSEFGFQSFPCMRTIEGFTLPEDRNIFSRVMEKHQRNGAANGKIMNYLSQTFLYPNNFETLLYASQLLQAEAMKYGVEHLRRNRGRCMGTIYWQLNDCWPTASWASIDYYGRWKALQYYAKRFFAPILLSCEEEGCLTQEMDINAENYHIRKSAVFAVTNESMEHQVLDVKWSLRNPASEILEEGMWNLELAPLSVWKSESVIFENARLRSDYLYYELWRNGECLSRAASLFCPPKHFEFEDPMLELEVRENTICVHARKFAKNVEIYSLDSDLLLSDNFFDMNAGSREIRIIRGECVNLKARSVYDIH